MIKAYALFTYFFLILDEAAYINTTGFGFRDCHVMCHGESDTWAENRVARIMPRKLMSSAVGLHFACVPCSLPKWALGCLKKLQGQSPTVVVLASLTFSSCLKLAPALALDPLDLRPIRLNLRSVFCQAAHSLLASGSHFCPSKTLPKYSATTTYGLGAGKSKLAFKWDC